MIVYSTKETAIKLRLSERRVRKLLEEGRLAGKKVGRDWIVLSLIYIPRGRGKDKQPRKGGRNETKS